MEPFKNELSFEKALRISEAIKVAHPPFSQAAFRKNLEASLLPLELKQRVNLIADHIERTLPKHPPEIFEILVRSLTANDQSGGGLKKFLIWPLTEVVARRGISHFPEAMQALSEMTKYFTAEWAIRPFITQLPEKTFAQLHEWCEHPNEHVRRLVSEGSRPFLPWGGNLPQLLEKPYPTLALLENLHRDDSNYVRLSVSNHLNDFSKKHPELVIDLLRRWLAESPDDPRIERLARHACRTLLKAGHPGALALHGYGSAEKLEIHELSISPQTVKLGGVLEYHFRIHNPAKKGLQIMFDYAIHHLKANGKQTAKVFKGKKGEIKAGDSWEISGRHAIKPVTTRVYYPGLHQFELRINGRSFPPVDFHLEF